MWFKSDKRKLIFRWRLIYRKGTSNKKTEKIGPPFTSLPTKFKTRFYAPDRCWYNLPATERSSSRRPTRKRAKNRKNTKWQRFYNSKKQLWQLLKSARNEKRQKIKKLVIQSLPALDEFKPVEVSWCPFLLFRYNKLKIYFCIKNWGRIPQTCSFITSGTHIKMCLWN